MTDINARMQAEALKANVRAIDKADELEEEARIIGNLLAETGAPHAVRIKQLDRALARAQRAVSEIYAEVREFDAATRIAQETEEAQ